MDNNKPMKQKTNLIPQLSHDNKEIIKKTDNLEISPFEKPIFLVMMTFIGGYVNAYTYITRNKILANMHTANMSKFGISIALGEWKNALSFFIPMLACILGATFSGYVKYIITKNKYKSDWRKIALILESLALFGVGLIPLSSPDFIVTTIISFFMGYQLCLCRKCIGIAFNTTICTGNLRTVGQLLYDALDEKNKDCLKKLITFTIITFSFALGAIPGTIISMALSTKSVWICSFILLAKVAWVSKYDASYKQ